jgi:aerobic C4-dicarboxylate transport protein
VSVKKAAGNLYVQVLVAIAIGILFGLLDPLHAAAMKPLGDGFIKLVKMLITPIVFCTVVIGISQAGELRDVGRIGLRAIVYFELVTTLALVIGLVVVNVLKPGSGLAFDPAAADMKSVAAYATASQSLSTSEFIVNIFPESVVSAFQRNDVLQVLCFSLFFGVSLLHLGRKGTRLLSFIDVVSKAMFSLVGLVMRAAPVGAFGAMSFTIGKYGLGALLTLGKLMAGMYITCILFVFLVLGGILAAMGVSVFRFLRYIADEILIVLGTSSSESALPRLMDKMEHLGCARKVVGLVVPTGYSFNLDGTSIYMTMAAVFVAQVSGVHLSLGQEMTLLAVLLLTSKGAAAVTGSGFVTLAATLAVFPTIPLAGLTLLVGVDRFMSEARAITNLIGNATATLVVSKWEGALDSARAQRILKLGPAAAGLDKPL